MGYAGLFAVGSEDLLVEVLRRWLGCHMA